MQIVNLDFRAAHKSRLGQWVALVGVLALLVVGAAFWWLARAHNALEGRQSSLQAEQRRLTDAGQAAAAFDPDGEIARRLTRPWQTLLLALESASDPAVALIEIRPDPARRSLRLTAEAATLEEALAYVKKLQALPVLARAHLVNYTPAQQTAGPAVLRFIVQADWVGG